MINISSLTVEIDNKKIIDDLSLSIKKSETHIIMGTNGSGKTSLALTISGFPQYKVVNGSIIFKGQDILDLDISERSLLGIYLSFQNAVEIEGLTAMTFLREAYNNFCKKNNQEIMKASDFIKRINELSAEVTLDKSILNRPLNIGLSGGEKKKFEILQIKLFDPDFCIFDETDAGLDIDALKIVKNTIKERQANGKTQILITHYTNLFSDLHVDKIHIIDKGKIVKSGNQEIAEEINEKGYKFLEAEL